MCVSKQRLFPNSNSNQLVLDAKYIKVILVHEPNKVVFMPNPTKRQMKAKEAK